MSISPCESDSANISSDEAASLAAAHAAVIGAPEVREDRVNALKAAIAAGSYAIDSRTLAAKLRSAAGHPEPGAGSD